MLWEPKSRKIAVTVNAMASLRTGMADAEVFNHLWNLGHTYIMGLDDWTTYLNRDSRLLLLEYLSNTDETTVVGREWWYFDATSGVLAQDTVP